MTLPRDVKRLALKTAVRRLALLFISEAFVLSVVYMYREDFLDRPVKSVAVICFFVLLPVFLTGAYRLTRSSWKGTILDIKCTTTYHYNVVSVGRKVYCKNNIILTVKKDNGVVRKINYLSSDFKTVDAELERIRVGDRVISVWGLDRLIIEPNVCCEFCGSVNPADNDKCINCNCSLIKE